MTTTPPDEDRAGKRLAYARWVWLVGSVVALLSTAAAAATATDPDASGLALILVIGTGVQAAIAIPAALALRRRANWARITLYVMSLLCIGGIAHALRIGAWPSVVLNLVLASPIGVLADKDVKAACATSGPATARTE